VGPAIPVVAAIAGAGVSGIFGGTLLGMVAGFAVSTAISQIGGRAFAKKPKQPAFATEAGGRTTVVRSSVESHKVIYGQAKVSGPLVYVETTDGTGSEPLGYILGLPTPATKDTPAKNKYLHMVIPLAGHEVEEIGTVYLNDQAITLDADGWATSEPYAKSTTATTRQILQQRVTSMARVSGVVTVTTAAAHGFNVGETVVLDKTSPVSNSRTITSTPTSTTFTFSAPGSAFSEPQDVKSTATVTRDITSTTTKSYVRVRKHLGAADQAADTVMVGEVPNWTTNRRLRGIAYLYVRLEYNQDVFPLGIPNISAVVKGKKVFDPRTALTAWSDNSALCIRDYLASSYGFGCGADEINDSYLIAAANVSDEAVAITGGSQARYTCNGVVDTATAPLDNLGALVTSLAGAVTYVQGQFRVYAGAYDAPTTDIPLSMLASGVKTRARTPRKELFNAVKGTYVDPTKNWQPTDFPFVTNATYEAQDNGERIYKDLELPFTTDPTRAQRIGKLILEKARQGIIVEMTMNHSGMPLAVFDTVTHTNPRMGWDAKPFRILKWSSNGTGPVSLVLQEESAASYEWNNGEATTIDDAPDTELPDYFTVQPPGTPLIEEVLYVTTDGSGVKTKAVVEWPAASEGFLKEYQVEFKLTSEVDYTIAGRTTGTMLELPDLVPGAYHWRVKALNTLGVSSEYSTVAIKTLYGLTAAPADVQNFSLNVIGGAAHLSWDQATDLDVKIGGTVRIRHTPAVTGQNWNAAIDIGQALPGIATQAVLPLLGGTYLAKFFDSSGNGSGTAALIVTDAVSLIGLNLVETLTENPAFAGDKDGVALDSTLGGLKLSGTAIWSEYPGDVSTWPMIGSLGGVASSGTYDCGVIDLGAVYPCKLTASLAASGYDIGDLFSARVGNVSTWTSFSGGGLSDFTSSYWSSGATNVTVIADQAAGPNGTITADEMRESATSGNHHIFGNESELAIPGQTMATIELYVKPNGRNFQIQMNWLGEDATVDFDLTNGVVEDTNTNGTIFGEPTIHDCGITLDANGFYRLWVTAESGDPADDLIDARYALLNDSFSRSYSGDGVSGAYLADYRAYRGALQPTSVNDDVNAELYIRTTNDDPALENWSEPRKFFVGDYSARAFWPQLRLTSQNTNHNILVSELSFTVDMPEREETGRNITSGAGTYSVVYANPFREAPTLGITLKGGSSGDYWEITNETEEGFDIVFKNAAGVTVSRTFDWAAKGYGKQVT
jgi:hypothetical protein